MSPDLLAACAAVGVAPACFESTYRQRWSLEPQVSRNREDIADRAKVLRWLRDRGMSLPQIAQATGLRSHTTVMYALQRAEGRKVREGRVKTKVRIIPRKDRMKIAEQRKLAKVKAETPFAGSAVASEAVQPVIATPQAPARPEPSTAARCPACGKRTLAQTPTIDGKGRTLWRCTRTGACRWEAWGRA